MNLEIVVVEANDVDIGEPSDFTCRTADTASNIKNTHAGSKVHLSGEVVFMSGEGSGEGFTLVETGKVERLRPTVFIQFSSAVVVA